MSKQRIIVVHDQENHEFVQFPVYGESWQRAVSQISGEGGDTQLVNAMKELGFKVFEELGEGTGPLTDPGDE